MPRYLFKHINLLRILAFGNITRSLLRYTMSFLLILALVKLTQIKRQNQRRQK